MTYLYMTDMPNSDPPRPHTSQLAAHIDTCEGSLPIATTFFNPSIPLGSTATVAD